MDHQIVAALSDMKFSWINCKFVFYTYFWFLFSVRPALLLLDTGAAQQILVDAEKITACFSAELDYPRLFIKSDFLVLLS